MKIIKAWGLIRPLFYALGALGLLFVVGVFWFQIRSVSECSKLVEVVSREEVEGYFNNWFANLSDFEKPLSSLRGIASIDATVSPGKFKLLHLDLEGLGVSRKDVAISFNRNIDDWEKEFLIRDVKSVSLKLGRYEIIFLVNNSVEFGQLEWRIKEDMIQKVDDGIFVVCDE